MASRQGDGTLHLETSALHLELSAALKARGCEPEEDGRDEKTSHSYGSKLRRIQAHGLVRSAKPCHGVRKEMEMLSDPKRGWQGRVGGVAPTTNVSGRIGRQKAPRRTQRSVDTALRGGAKAGPLRAPKDHAQFQRDWRRRCRTNGERRDYLRLVGPKNASALFRVEMEPDVLGQVISVVCEEFPFQPQRIDAATPATQENEERSGAPTRGDAAGSTAITANGNASADEAGARLCLEWLRALSRTGRFAVNILFLADNEKQALARAFDLTTAVFGDEEISSLRKAYAV
ncbi:unnamed protein product [Ectocarpus sp. CCAP 1310/34]|nr:unnamed protein product [Ectocarpus sp. CCAP 1310/34]